MKKKILRTIIVFVVVFVAMLIVILGYNKLQDRNKQKEDTIVKKNVKVITSETNKEKQPVSVTDDSIIFNLNPGYKKGDVIVSGITSTSKNGFIRKVIGIENKGDNCVIKTEPAVLTDVFEKAQIYKRIKLTEEGNKSVSYSIGKDGNNGDVRVQNAMSEIDNSYRTIMLADKKETDDENNGIEYVFGQKFEKESDPFTISGETGFDVWLDIKIEIKHGNITCGMAIKSKEEGKILLKCGKDWNKEKEWGLWEKSLPNYEFVVAGIPIVVTNKLELNAEAGAELEGNIGLSYELASETTTGFEFKSKTGKVKEIKEIDYDSDGLQWETISVSGEASAKIAIHYISKLYGCSGIDVSAGISGKAEGEANQTANTDLEGGYAGSLDLSINPEIQGELIVDIPVFAEDLKKQPLFEAKMKPLWSKHWESSVKWKDDLEWTETGKQGSKYITRYSEVNNIACPVFQFDVPWGWKIESEEVGNGLDEIDEKVVLTNEKGVTVTYWACQHQLGGKSELMLKADISKVADSEFKPTIPDGVGVDESSADEPYANLGTMIVAKIHVTGEMDMKIDMEYSDCDSVFYAVVPESYVGEREFIGQAGEVDEFSFPYPTPYAFIAESADGTFTAGEEKQIINILKSFKEAE
ncbi:hypothetical protein [Dorea formicigenerans]|uniref:Uncharacterized protein n=1 Tax=Dorea formicigenerans TaxID=39486 RepID=A0A3E4MI34_9FIRM|nr:hypothetical protein [Dorea formicigenerans]RGK49469.1 hypothetical protein DXD10_04850 [Dorea formicigenerans]